MVNRVSSFFPKSGHSATQTELKTNMNTRKVKRHRNSDTKNTGNREPKQNYRLGTVSSNTAKYILKIKSAPIIYQTKKEMYTKCQLQVIREFCLHRCNTALYIFCNQEAFDVSIFVQYSLPPIVTEYFKDSFNYMYFDFCIRDNKYQTHPK